MQSIPVILRDKKRLNTTTFEYVFTLPDEVTAQFYPGQYIWLKLNKIGGDDAKGSRRAFSLSSIDTHTGTFSILFRASESIYKKYLLSLQIGETVHITKPAGSSFIVKDITHTNVIFVAGGVGIAPFLSFLRSTYSTNQSNNKLLFINSSVENQFLNDEIKQLCAQKQVEYFPLIGELQTSMLSLEDITTGHFYISGSNRFVQNTYKELISKGVTRDRMFFEQFYPSFSNKMKEYFDKFTQHPVIQNDEYAFSENSNINPFKMLVDSTSSHLIVTDENGYIQYANKAATRITGYSYNEMIGNTPRLWGGLMNHNFYVELWKKIKIDRQPFVGEIKNRRKNGEEYYSLCRITPIEDEGQLIGFVASEEDITEKVILEKRTLEQKNQLLYAKQQDEAMLSSIGEGLIAYDNQMHVQFVNTPAVEMLGYEPQDLIGHNFIDVVQAESEQGTGIISQERILTKALKSNSPIKDSFVYVRKDGSRFVAQVTVSPVVLDGKISGLIQVFRDITKERKIDALKTDFISLASHQLRTPLSTINWYLEMVLHGDAGEINEEQRKFISEAYKGSSRMVELVNALLNVARIEAGTFLVDPQPADLVQIARSVLDELKPQIDDKKQHVTLEKQELPQIMLDQQLMRIIFQNLLTNSVKYTPEGGTVQISITILPKGSVVARNQVITEDHYLIIVKDSGIGIPQSDREHIFDKLYRASNVVSTDTEGTGLGLYIMKSIIDQSNGYIWFDSEQNKGTTFYVSLPLSGMIKKEGSRKIE